MKRIAVIVVGVVVAATACVALIAVLASRDSSQVHGATGPGTFEPEAGAGSPPTSGAHEDEPVTRDETELSDAQILAALALGNVVLTYPDATPPDALVAVRDEVAGAFDAELAAAGQAVILARRSGDVQALAWQRRLVASGPDDPALREFAEAWLGQGAG